MTRTKSKLPFLLVGRDYMMLADINEYKAGTTEELGWKHFKPVVIRQYGKDAEGRRIEKGFRVVTDSNCVKRTGYLYKAGYIDRVEISQLLSAGKQHYVYTITRAGVEALADYLGCSVEELGYREVEKRLRSNYAHHFLKLNDIRYLLSLALKDQVELELVEWRDDLQLQKEQHGNLIPVRRDGVVHNVKLFPDGFFKLSDNNGLMRSHFVEVDTGSETIQSSLSSYNSVAEKMRAYCRLLFKDGQNPQSETLLQKYYQVPSARVLVVTSSDARLERIIKVSEAIGAERRFWFTTHERLTTPRIERYTRKIGKSGREVEAYRAIMPDLLKDKLWRIAQDGMPGTWHSLDEAFNVSK
jgi:hypothetical protein